MSFKVGYKNDKIKGRPVAKIKYKGYNKILYLEDYKYENSTGINDNNTCEYCDKKLSTKYSKRRHLQACKYKIANDMVSSKCIEGKITLLPSKNHRDAIYITGPPGSGKSTIIADYIKEFNRVKPKYKIILITTLDDDLAYHDLLENNKIKNKFYKLNLDTIINDPPKLEEFEKSLVIFDDVESSDKTQTNIIYNLLEEILKKGRDHTYQDKDIYVLFTNHQIFDYKKTRDFLYMATQIVFFPHSGTATEIRRLLKSKFGADNEQIHKVLNIKSRWVIISKIAPIYLLYQNGACLLDGL